MDQASENRLAKVHPELAKRVRELVVGIGDIRVVQGIRTYAEQDALYAQGRSKPGQRVTNARGGQSNHNFGLAVDLCPFKDGKPDWEDDHTFNLIGEHAKRVGLEWGGAWKHIVDKPHVQLPGLTVAQCASLYAKGGLEAVWQRAFPINTLPTPQQPQSPLREGDRGEAVKKLQAALALPVDGIFGPKTKATLIAYQKAHGLDADGIAGAKTRAKLGV